MANILTVYYSHKGENYFPDGIKFLYKGNTEYAAEYIQKAVGGDVSAISGCSVKIWHGCCGVLSLESKWA